jgi:hypothetical protein
VLFVLLAVEGVTILKVGRFLTLHFFIGMLLVGPVALKAGSVMYRFSRYYTGSAPYRRKGPPQLALRLIGPILMMSTAGVFGTGIALAVAGPGHGPWLFLHKASFVIWFCVIFMHVSAYLVRAPALIAAEFSGGRGGRHAAQVAGRVAGRVGNRLGGRGMRITLLIASLAAGLVIAMLTVHLAAPWHVARFNH